MKTPELTVEDVKAKELNEYKYIATWEVKEKVFSNPELAVEFVDERVKVEGLVYLWLEENGVRESRPYYVNEI